ncbi:hypothetical protein LguiB_001272 [Lonicera macranthoides]
MKHPNPKRIRNLIERSPFKHNKLFSQSYLSQCISCPHVPLLAAESSVASGSNSSGIPYQTRRVPCFEAAMCRAARDVLLFCHSMSGTPE